MAFLVGGANSASGGYEIENSLMFNNADDPNLAITFGSAGDRQKFTISAWIKKGDTSADRALIGQGGTSSGNPRGLIFVGSSLRFTSNTTGSSTEADVETNAKLRDHSAWYHVVAAIDTTQGTAANRIKLYINGEQQTSLATATYPNQNFEMNWNNNTLHTVGRYPNNDAYHMDGYISEFYFIDGTQYAASNFGETNDNGVWIPKDAKGDLTFGDNGFYLEFQQTGTSQNASGMGADTSGETNHLAVNNLSARDVATDTPTNNFATLNPLSNLQSGTLSQGNTKLVTSSSANSLVPSTIGVQNGKWYVEVYFDSTNYGATGILNDSKVTESDQYFGKSGSLSRFIRYDGQKSTSNTNSTYMAAVNGGDKVVQIALDLDNGKITFGANGQWADGSGNTDEDFGDATAAFTDIISSGNYTNKFAMITFGDENSGTSDTLLTNFGGCPPYAITGTVYSDANGYGSFKYEVPSGYFALCTKNLAEYG